MDSDKLVRTVVRIADQLVSRDFRAIERESIRIRGSVADLVAELDGWPRPLGAANPDDAMGHIELTEIQDRPGAWSVDVFLWEQDGTKSDLALILTLYDSGGELYRYEIDDLLVP